MKSTVGHLPSINAPPFLTLLLVRFAYPFFHLGLNPTLTDISRETITDGYDGRFGCRIHRMVLRGKEGEENAKRRRAERFQESEESACVCLMSSGELFPFPCRLVRERPMLTPVTIRSYIRQPGVIIRKLAAVFGDQKYGRGRKA